MVMEATAPPITSPPGDEWRVLSSGALAYRLPPTKEGKPVWLDAHHRVKLCEHGHSAAQIHHWQCAARPRAKPEWVTCTCADAKGSARKVSRCCPPRCQRTTTCCGAKPSP